MKTTHVPGIDFTRVFDLIQYQKQKVSNPKLIQQKKEVDGHPEVSSTWKQM